MDNKSNTPLKISLSWSGGKDSAFTLWQLQQDKRYEIVSLHTTFGEESRRVGLHGIHENLIEQQAESIGIRLDKIYYPASGDNQAYEKAMGAYLEKLKAEGVLHIAYGDIFLADLKKYREEKLAEAGFEAVFPLWGKNTEEMVREFLAAGFQTIICAADGDKIGKDFVGRDLDKDFVESLPEEVDPCGENGEFHTFCYAGPIFKEQLSPVVQEITQKSYDIKYDDGKVGKKWFWFAAVEFSSCGFHRFSSR